MPTYTGSTREQAIIKAVMGTCRPCCRGSGSGSTGSPTVCGCNIGNSGLCLNVENNASLVPPLVGQLPLEGSFPLTETTWAAVVSDYEYNVVCIDTTDPEDPITVSDDWYFDPSAFLTNPGGRWFTTSWQTDSKGYFDGGTSRDADGKPISWKHVVNINESGCTTKLYTFSRIPDDIYSGHTTIKTWGQEFTVGNPFYYSVDDEGSPIHCLTQTVSNNASAGTVTRGTTSCTPFLIEDQVDSVFGGTPTYLLWDTGADNIHQFTAALWSIYPCG